MTKINNKNEIKILVSEFISKKEISNNQFASIVCVSPATVSNILNDKWESISDEMWQKVWNAIKIEDWQLIETVNFKTIQKVCNDAKRNHKMVSVIGFTGAGKTVALTSFYQSHSNVFYIEYCKSMKPKQFFKKLLQEMGVQYVGSIYEMVERVTDELNSKINPLIIIDEAGKLTQTLLHYLHDLRNKTFKGTGILLAGVEYFKSNMEKWTDRQKEGMPEFFDRVYVWQELNQPTKREIRAIAEANGATDEALVSELYKLKSFRQIFNRVTSHLQFEQEALV